MIKKTATLIVLLLITGLVAMAQTPGSDSSKILFLTYELEMVDSAAATYRCTLKRSFMAPGKLTANNNEGDYVAANYLEYQVTEADGRKGQLIKIRNPLMMDYEFPVEGNQLSRATIASKKAECTIRLQWQGSYKNISIFSTANKSSTAKKIYDAAL
jgi:hypothetical protein